MILTTLDNKSSSKVMTLFSKSCFIIVDHPIQISLYILCQYWKKLIHMGDHYLEEQKRISQFNIDIHKLCYFERFGPPLS